MDIKQLSYFMAIAESGSISAAARKLNISQPPLSAQLRLLEEELGVLLMERGPRRILLTDAGRLLYQRAEKILALTDAAQKELSGFAKGNAGILRLGTISSSGTALLEERLPLFHQELPHVKFELHEGNTFQLLELIHANILEIAIVRTPFPQEGLSCTFLSPEPMAAVGSRTFFPDWNGKPCSLEQLGELPLIYYRRFESLLSQAFEGWGITPHIVCVNDDARTTLLWAKAGLGVGLVPLSSAALIPGEETCIVPLEEPQLVTRIAAVRREHAPLSAAAKHFLEVFQKML